MTNPLWMYDASKNAVLFTPFGFGLLTGAFVGLVALSLYVGYQVELKVEGEDGWHFRLGGGAHASEAKSTVFKRTFKEA